MVTEAVHWDHQDNFNKRKKDHASIHLDNLKNAIQSCGVTFEIREKRNIDGKGSGQYDFTILLGPDKKKLLNELPEKLTGLVRPSAEVDVKRLWINFSIIYSIVTCKAPSQDMTENMFCKAKEWINLFVSLGDTYTGYKRCNVMPYIHAMAYNLPKFLETYKTVKLFSGQGVEKNNDVARSIILKKSNNWDAAVDILKLESRQWDLREKERMKRTYTKRNSEYWEHELQERKMTWKTYHSAGKFQPSMG